MLARLSIRDIVLIDQLDLEFSQGLTILTGETGAGKSILLDALALALGARGDGALVRHGEAQGQVTAVFELSLDHPIAETLAKQDIEFEGDLILRRVQMVDGRTRAFVNDQSVSAQTLRALGRRPRRNPRPARRTRAARSFDASRAGGRLRRSRRWRRRERAARSPRCAPGKPSSASSVKTSREAEKAADFARHASEELTKLAIKPGEEEALAAERQRMMQGEKVAADIRDAHESLSGDSAALPLLANISRRLQRRMPQAPDLIEPSIKALEEAMEALEAATLSVEAALRACDFDPRDLEQLRGAAVRAARHGAQIFHPRRRAAGARREIRS